MGIIQDYITTFDEKKNKEVSIGILKDRKLVKKINSKKHLIRNFNGYGIQKEALDKIKNEIDWVYFNVDKVFTYKISMNMFKEKSFVADLGHGKQYIIQLRYLTKED